MFGFVLGTICLVALIKMHRIRRRVYMAGCGAWDGGGWHGHSHRGWRGGEPRWGGGGRRFWLRGFFERLQTTPGQEKAIVAAIDEAADALGRTRGEWDATRKDVARAFTAPSFDAELLGHTFARHDERLEDARRAVTGALARIHDALDERQRTLLAEMIDKDSFRGFASGFHPYR